MIASAVTTVAAVITTIIITVQDRRRAAGNLAAERVRSDEQLREEREHSAAQIEEERRLAREREQLSEAYAVQVFLGEKRAPGRSRRDGREAPGGSGRQPWPVHDHAGRGAVQPERYEPDIAPQIRAPLKLP